MSSSSAPRDLTGEGFGLAADLTERVQSAVARWTVAGAPDDEIDAALMGVAAAAAGAVFGLVARRRGGHAFIMTSAEPLAQMIVDRAAVEMRGDGPVRVETRGLR